MFAHRLIASIVFAGFLHVSEGAAQEPSSEARLIGSSYVENSKDILRLDVLGADGPHFLLGVRRGDAGSSSHEWLWLGEHPLGPDGTGQCEISLPTGWRDLARSWTFAAFYRGNRGERQSSLLEIPLEEPRGQVLDFDWGLGARPLAAGEQISENQPWWEFVEISAISADTDAGTDMATLARTDASGDEPFGLVLTVAANDVDANDDGLIDNPQSDPSGGTVVFQFPGHTDVTSLWVVDVRGEGGEIRTYKGDVLAGTNSIPDLGGDGSDEMYLDEGDSITRIEVQFTGSGAVGDPRLEAHPMILNFDETTTGVPLGLQAGSSIGGEYSEIGLFHGAVWADNANPEHPDRAILFDSANPSGGDGDLRTPGGGVGNDTPHRMLLIIAENDVDEDKDGRIDVPDDEASGGVLAFTWYTNSVLFQSVTVVDIDDEGSSFVRVWDRTTDRPEDIPLENLGDNSVQTVYGDIETRQIEIHLSGSGAVAELRLLPQFHD